MVCVSKYIHIVCFCVYVENKIFIFNINKRNKKKKEGVVFVVVVVIVVVFSAFNRFISSSQSLLLF